MSSEKDLLRQEASLSESLKKKNQSLEEIGFIFYQRARIRVRLQQFQRALADYNASVKFRPKSSETFFERAALQERHLNHFSNSLSGYSKAVSIEKKAKYYLSRGLLLENRFEKFADALDDYNSCVAVDPNYAFGYNNRALLLENHFKKHDEALKDYDQALKIMPKLWEARFNRARLLNKMNKPRTAIVDFTACINIDSPSKANQQIKQRELVYKAYLKRGEVYHSLKEFDKCLEDYTKVLENPENPKKIIGDAFYKRGVVYHRVKKKYNLALHDFMECIARNPEEPKYYVHRGTLYLQHFKLLDLALADFNKAIGLDKRYSRAYFRRSSLYKKKKKFKLAMKDVSRCVKLQPSFYKAYVNRANLHVQFSAPEKALGDYEKALELIKLIDEKNPVVEEGEKKKRRLEIANIHNNVGYLHLFLLKNMDNAYKNFSEGIELDPKNMQAFLNRGILEQKRGNIQKSLLDFSKAIEIGGSLGLDKALNERGELYMNNLKKFELANKDFSRAIEMNPCNVKATYNRAVLNMTAFNKPELALMGFNRVIKLDPNNSNAFIQRAKLRKEKFNANAEALEDYKIALELQEGKKKSPKKQLRGSLYEEIFMKEEESTRFVPIPKRLEKIEIEQGNLLQLIGEVLPRENIKKCNKLKEFNSFIQEVNRMLFQFYHYFTFILRFEWEKKIYGSLKIIEKMLSSEDSERIKKFIHEFCLKEIVLHSPEEYHTALSEFVDKSKFSRNFILFTVMKENKVHEFQTFFHSKMVEYFEERIMMYVRTQYIINFMLVVQKKIDLNESNELLKKGITLSIQNCDPRIIEIVDLFWEKISEHYFNATYTDTLIGILEENWMKDKVYVLTKKEYETIKKEIKFAKRFEKVEKVDRDVGNLISKIDRIQDFGYIKQKLEKIEGMLSKLEVLFKKEDKIHPNISNKKVRLLEGVKNHKISVTRRRKVLRNRNYRFEGEWGQDHTFKKGKLFYKGKLRYEGEFYDGKYHGSGVKYCSMNVEIDGIWRNGKLYFENLTNEIVKQTRSIKLPKISSEDLVGSGSYSTVFRFEMFGKVFAAKIIKKEFFAMGYLSDDDIIDEARQIMNIIKCHYVCLEEPSKGIITEFCDLNSLNHYIRSKRQRRKRITFRQVLNIFEQIANGMRYLHSCDVVHRDLKNENIMLKTMSDGEVKCKIIDFGTSKRMEEAKTRHMNSNVGSMFYVAPEVMKKPDKGYTRTCDVFSFGVIIFIMFYGMEYKQLMNFFHPQCVLLRNWEIETPKHSVYLKIKKKKKNFERKQEFRSKQTSHLIELMKKCLIRDPEKRPSFDLIHEELLEIIKISPSMAKKRSEKKKKKMEEQEKKEKMKKRHSFRV